jgi:Iron-containing redox enzyme
MVPPVAGQTSVPARESRRLRGRLELVLPALQATDRRLLGHPRLREIYPEYLVLTHGVIRASVPLMEAAFAACRLRPDDGVAVLLAEYLDQHIDEERGHDDWLLADLEFLGLSREQVLDRVPPPTVAALVGSQYYWIAHVHPVGLLGYIALLEGYPPRPLEVAHVQAATGYGPQAFRTLLLHADLDPHHGQDLDDLLDRLPLTDRLRTLVGVSALTSVETFVRAQQELLDRYRTAGDGGPGPAVVAGHGDGSGDPSGRRTP